MGRSGPAGSGSGTAVELRLAGTFSVVRDGAQLTDGEIGSRKSRTLLKLLAVERPGLVTIDRIAEILWPDERPASPEQNVARRAASYAEAAVAADPLDEAAHRWYMSAAAAAGEQARALAAYEALRQRLGRELGADPAPQTRELHLAILREQDGGLALSGSGRGVPPGPRPDAILLAGRDRESKVLREAWAAAAGGQPGPGTRLLVLATVRAENDAQVGAALAPVARRVWAGPLAPDAVAQLARAAGRGELAERILEQTRGHTLFVVEVLRALASGEEGVPESLRTAVQARVRRAGPGVEALLRAAAVLGATVDPLTVGVMLDLVPATALELCEAALGARLLVVSGRDYEFANDLIREVLYASTPEPTRLAYHRRAADLLTGQPESLARHAAAAGDWLRAGRAWLRADEGAMGRYAASDALGLATQALEAGERADDLEVSARALVLRGRALEATGAHAAALEDLTRGAEGARAELGRAARLAGQHGLAHVLHEASEARQRLG